MECLKVKILKSKILSKFYFFILNMIKTIQLILNFPRHQGLQNANRIRNLFFYFSKRKHHKIIFMVTFLGCLYTSEVYFIPNNLT